MAALHGGLAFVTASSIKDQLAETPINFSASGDNTVVAGAAGLGIYVFKYFLVVGAATNLTFKDGTTALTGAIPLVANMSMVFDFDTRPWYSTASGNALIINSSVAVQVSGRVYYLQGGA
jgi:hypothetical protein